MRLDAYISQNTDLSRSEAQRAIKQGRVRVNGNQAQGVSLKLTGEDLVTLDDATIHPLTTRYLMLHKPAGYVCANSDAEHPTVLDLIDLPRKSELQIAGRLDLDTTGLVLITDDGQWNHRITAPRRHCEKTYRVTTAEAISDETADLFAAGVSLHGEPKPTLPAQLELLGPTEARLRICEGKYHQVKRMFAAVNNRVVALHREQVGSISLDSALKAGEWRPLRQDEINQGIKE